MHQSKQSKQFRNFQNNNEESTPKDSQLHRQPTNVDAVIEQDTIPLPAIVAPTYTYKVSPQFIRYVATNMLRKAKEPDPESWSNSLLLRTVNSRASVSGWLPVLMLTNALGLFLVAYGCAVAIHTSTDQQVYLWLGLLLIFVPSFLRLLSPTAKILERIGILCTVGFSIYLVPVILSPLQLIFVDEYLHWRTVDDILRSGHLFSINSMLPISPLFPGLEIVTDALSSLSGLNSYTSGLIVIALARIVMILSLFKLFEQITKSARTAGIGTILYMANSGFFMFDSLFLYESLGLAIGVFLIYTLVRMETAGNSGRGLILTALIAVGALTITHHVSDYFFIGLLVLWIVIRKYLRLSVLRSNVTKVAVFGILLSVIWAVFFARSVVEYLYSPVYDSFAQFVGVLTGTNSARHLFVDHTGGHPTPIWQELIMLSSVGLVSLAIPFAFLCNWHRYRYKAFPYMLGILSFIYPLIQSLRFTGESVNIADRSSPYIFIAVSFALAIFITQMWQIRNLKWKQIILLTSIASTIFLGGNMLGSGPSWRLMPSGYTVGDDTRSVSTQGIQAALWTLSHLGPDNRISTDSINSLLMNTYGDQRIVTDPFDGVIVAPVFYATHFHLWEAAILQSGRVHYLVVDLRLSTSLPAKGYYFEGEEPEAAYLNTPISREALTKFDTVPQINREFDSGDIVIYDTGELINASKNP